MSSRNSLQMQHAAKAFDDLLVAAIFRKWAAVAADTVRPARDARLLDIACGTGVLARELAARVGDPARVTGVDSNDAMLDVAAQIAPGIDWKRADAKALPFEDGLFDHVFCQFGLMLFDDPEAALGEMWRVLRPGGQMTVLVFDELDRNPIYKAIANVYEEWIGPVLSDSLRAAFSLGRRQDLTSLFDRAGTQPARIEGRHVLAEFDSVEALVNSDVRGWFPFSGVVLKQEVVDAITADMKRHLASHVQPDGRIVFRVDAHLATVDRPLTATGRGRARTRRDAIAPGALSPGDGASATRPV
ncbi:class I SAM-dependent methyltransferase [Stappia stellulata]|uniref:class I SAM-dependent methyltransferase n=1 Tax=Stappia stellulata TaxID=71235 RepID=UPI000407FED7|nr:class I SAM-dependent methyltransferase [Stappia stellulata]